MSFAAIHSRTLGGPRFTILGLQLEPLTLGHVALLHGLDCMDARDPGELALACVVCSMPWRDVMPALQDPDFQEWAKGWGDALGEWDFHEKRGDWDDYMRVNMELPKVIVRSSGGGGGESAIPPHQTLRVVLLSRLGYSADTVNDTPYLQALWDVVTLRSNEGAVTVCSKTEEEIDAEIAKIDVDAILARFQPKEEPCSN